MARQHPGTPNPPCGNRLRSSCSCRVEISHPQVCTTASIAHHKHASHADCITSLVIVTSFCVQRSHRCAPPCYLTRGKSDLTYCSTAGLFMHVHSILIILSWLMSNESNAFNAPTLALHVALWKHARRSSMSSALTAIPRSLSLLAFVWLFGAVRQPDQMKLQECNWT